MTTAGANDFRDGVSGTAAIGGVVVVVEVWVVPVVEAAAAAAVVVVVRVRDAVLQRLGCVSADDLYYRYRRRRKAPHSPSHVSSS